ncbi:MAG: hypothetical protein LBL34_06630 [Clostridiales bacterium]|nr:hypothetical protein [Clostridiales bacterium]
MNRVGQRVSYRDGDADYFVAVDVIQQREIRSGGGIKVRYGGIRSKRGE